MIQLKDYQIRVLDSLRAFFKQCSMGNSLQTAYNHVYELNNRVHEPYISVNAEGLSANMPYVCLRVPTGGGKTLLACYSAGIAMTELLHADTSIVLWLVPSNTILDQTADALRDPRHPYRRALEVSCGGAVEVLKISDAIQLSRAQVQSGTVVIVSTIQCFRVEDKTGRRVYGNSNGNLMEHFVTVPADRQDDLFKGPDGKPALSLVNVLRLHRPVVIVDEAHNARSDLSFNVLGHVSPSCIVEFTATPARKKHPSNVLHYVSASELKAADMVKLPLRVVARHPSQREQLLGEAVNLRNDLEKLAIAEAQATARYVRPIMLIQAESIADCEPLRDRLVNEFQLNRDEIIISTGKLDELKKIDDISAPKCKVRFVITVEKLREGWDCPFAYVLCSMKETRSATAIEQIVGRILRLPGATKLRHPDLNCSYAFSVSPHITDVLAELRDALEGNGFTSAEAERIVIPASSVNLQLGIQPQRVTFEHEGVDVLRLNASEAVVSGKVKVDVDRGAVTVFVPLETQEEHELAACFFEADKQKEIKRAALKVKEAEIAMGGSGASRKPSPYEQCLDFKVPLLCVEEDGELFDFDSTFLLEQPWKLSEKDASLSQNYNPTMPPGARVGFLDIGDRGSVQTGVFSEDKEENFVRKLHQQVLALGSYSSWSIESLVAWLDSKIDHQDIPIGESAEFLRKVVRGLCAKFSDLDIDLLALDRFRLRDEIEKRINQHRVSERRKAFQQFLLPDSDLVVDESEIINFKTMPYEPSTVYHGNYAFEKHYFGPKPGELVEKTSAGKVTEEFKCAQFLDDLPQVKFWVRNLPRRKTSFRLQTSTDWFYPDFVCLLNDDRVMVVEYKGQQLYSADDAEEKRLVGTVWAERSKGKCLFFMPTDGDFSLIRDVLDGNAS